MKLLSIIFSMTLAGCSGTRPTDIGMQDQRLAPCPDKPNCVTSQNADKAHFIEPLTYSGDQNLAYQKLLTVVQKMPGSELITKQNNYLYFEFKSRWLRFVDDAEFLFFPENQIQVRSASRLGHSDMGVNRKRIETIREQFESE